MKSMLRISARLGLVASVAFCCLGLSAVEQSHASSRAIILQTAKTDTPQTVAMTIYLFAEAMEVPALYREGHVFLDGICFGTVDSTTGLIYSLGDGEVVGIIVNAS